MKIESKTPLKKRDKEIYINICLDIWGVVPVDYDWAVNTPNYIKALKSIEDLENTK